MEKKSLIVGISIIIGFIILGIFINYTFKDIGEIIIKDMGEIKIVDNNRYEMITPNDTNIIIFDNETGRYWRKYIDADGGPTEWQEESMDFLNN